MLDAPPGSDQIGNLEMADRLRRVPDRTVVAGFDFSTGAVKGLAFNLDGTVLCEIRLPTDLWTEGGVSELNLMQLEGQARSAVRLLASRLREIGRLGDWTAIGISATHHTAGRIDAEHTQVRRATCWNDHSLAAFHAKGLERIGGQGRVRELIGGPWAIRYSLSHLVKDETDLSRADWQRTRWIATHGVLAAGYLTGRFDVTSVSSAASTGVMDLRSTRWRPEMLEALQTSEYRDLTTKQLPQIVDQNEPVGPVAEHVAIEAGLGDARPLVFPTSDDQQAGLAGGGAVDAGQLAVVLGNSAVVNGSSAMLPGADSTLDCMRLNWGPYLWMRCYNNGAQFLDRVVGPRPDWAALERTAAAVPAGCGGVGVLPFVHPEPSLGVSAPRFGWTPEAPSDAGVGFRAALEALAYLAALGVREHERAGQRVTRISVSGGIARSDLMATILATVLGRPVERLVSTEGPALGAAAAALAGLETHLRQAAGDEAPFTVADAVARMVRFREPANPQQEWRAGYGAGLRDFERRVAV
jgi:sugar (pentulose or hexulose) kinase